MATVREKFSETEGIYVTDGEEISQLMSLYALAIDAKQWRIFERVFTEDVQADYGPGGSWSNRADWQNDFEKMHVAYDATQHTMSNTSWTVAGDSGNVLTYGVFRLIRRGLAGGDTMAGGVWYDDVLRKTPEEWRICKRIARNIWLEGNFGMPPDGSPGVQLTSLSNGVEDGT